MDLIFAFGGSGAISQETFTRQKEYIKSFIDNYGTSHAGIRLALINYGSQQILTRFNNFNGNDIKTMVDRAVLRRGGTVENAFNRALLLFGDPRIVRPNAIKGFVVLSGDRIYERGNTLRLASNPLRNNGVKVISIGVGRNPDKQRPRDFASGEEFIFAFDKTKDLSAVVPGSYIALMKG
jgi:hypothetical protein